MITDNSNTIYYLEYVIIGFSHLSEKEVLEWEILMRNLPLGSLQITWVFLLKGKKKVIQSDFATILKAVQTNTWYYMRVPEFLLISVILEMAIYFIDYISYSSRK